MCYYMYIVTAYYYFLNQFRSDSSITKAFILLKKILIIKKKYINMILDDAQCALWIKNI